MKRFTVIMAGGGGTRFWPLSRQAVPKQVLNLTGNDFMINETIDRMKDLTSFDNVLIVTSRTQEKIMNKVLTNKIKRENILLEPMGRNTAPCIGYAAMVIQSRYKDGIMCVLPSDHYIKDQIEFRRIMDKACTEAESTDNLITIGIKPTFPCTGYGYIKMGDQLEKEVYKVQQFVEKPDILVAKEYIDSGNYLWNSGIFVWKASAILDNIERFLPKLYEKLMVLREYIDSDDEDKAIHEIYSQMESISIDYGIMERSNKVIVLPGDFGWSDVGSWSSLGNLYETDKEGNIVVGDHINIDTSNSIIYGKEHLIATIGIDNLVVVHTKDATLICAKDKDQEVKKIVDELTNRNMKLYL